MARLMATYQREKPASSPIVRNELDALAYAAYRMPATFAAARHVFQQVAAVIITGPEWVWTVGDALHDPGITEMVVLAYVVGELTAAQRADLVPDSSTSSPRSRWSNPVRRRASNESSRSAGN